MWSSSGNLLPPQRARHITTRSSTSLIMKLHCGSDSASRCCARRASARVAYVPFSSSPSYTLYGARGSSSSLAMLRLAGYYLVLERDTLEFLAEVLDPIFGRLVLNRRHESYTCRVPC